MELPERSEERVPALKAEPQPEGDLSRVRDIIFGGDSEEMLEQLHALRTARETLADDVSEVLPEAVLKRGESDPELSRALYPTVEEALETSVRRNPDSLVEIIFPVLGPAIRRSVRQVVSSMIEGLNRGIEYTFTLRGLKWRWEAFRSRRSLAEVVLAKSLVFRVEEVFLIHRETGLPLQQVSELEVVKQDPALVTAMLTAIQDFVRDSFAGAEDGQLHEFSVGAHEILVEAGPRAVIACAVRGQAPAALRLTLQETLEGLHSRHARRLEEFDGNAEPFAVVVPELEACLVSKQREVRRSPLIPVVSGLIIAGLGLWALVSFARSSWENTRWNEFVAGLRDRDGIFVASASKEGGDFVVTGLRDPLAEDPAVLLADSGLDADRVTLGFREWHAPHPDLVMKRWRAATHPPLSVSARLVDGVLRIEGKASGEWLSMARRLGPLLAGVRGVDTQGCDNLDLEPLRRALREDPVAGDWAVTFAAGRTALDEPSRARVAALATALEGFDARLGEKDAVLRVTLRGAGDPGLGEMAADGQARYRAEAVRLILASRSWKAIRIEVGESRGDGDGRVTFDSRIRDRVAAERSR